MSDKTLARRTAVKLYFKGRDISKDLSKYLLSLSFTDKEEDETDDEESEDGKGEDTDAESGEETDKDGEEETDESDI